MYIWKVMKLCEKQLRDVNESDILFNGLYRRCNTYKGGGGYDKFPEIYKNRFSDTPDLNEQFVVQLRGCPLRCPYCYVTEDGVHNGNCEYIPTCKLVTDFKSMHLPVFHLMGGAPAIYIDKWSELIDALPEGTVFHSDLLLLEGLYSPTTIKELASKPNCLYAVSIKGATPEEFKRNTGVEFNKDLFWRNLHTCIEADLPFYVTYTGMPTDSIEIFRKDVVDHFGTEDFLRDSFAIDLVHYKALED